MVSPHPEWDDCVGGLNKQDEKIVVSPVKAWFNDHRTVVRSVSEEEANAYSVRVYSGPPERETHDDIVVFRDARPAWEFAHLLTHYFNHTLDSETAKNHLLHSGGSTDEQWSPNHAVEDLNATEVLKTLLAPAPPPDAMNDVLS